MKKHKLLTALLAGTITLVGCTQKVETEPKKENTVPNVSDKKESNKNAKEYTFENGVAKLTDLELKITQYKVVQAGEKGNEHNNTPIIIFSYDVTNLTGKEFDVTSAWLAVFNGNDSVVQDNNPNKINKLEIALYHDEQTASNLGATIKKGGTLSHSIAYKLTDTTTPVVLKAYKGVSGELLGEQEFKLQ